MKNDINNALLEWKKLCEKYYMRFDSSPLQVLVKDTTPLKRIFENVFKEIEFAHSNLEKATSSVKDLHKQLEEKDEIIKQQKALIDKLMPLAKMNQDKIYEFIADEITKNQIWETLFPNNTSTVINLTTLINKENDRLEKDKEIK